jgi:hypothetical protein
VALEVQLEPKVPKEIMAIEATLDRVVVVDILVNPDHLELKDIKDRQERERGDQEDIED